LKLLSNFLKLKRRDGGVMPQLEIISDLFEAHSTG
jgi:hypothetical protein